MYVPEFRRSLFDQTNRHTSGYVATHARDDPKVCMGRARRIYVVVLSESPQCFGQRHIVGIYASRPIACHQLAPIVLGVAAARGICSAALVAEPRFRFPAPIRGPVLPSMGLDPTLSPARSAGYTPKSGQIPPPPAGPMAKCQAATPTIWPPTVPGRIWRNCGSQNGPGQSQSRQKPEKGTKQVREQVREQVLKQVRKLRTRLSACAPTVPQRFSRSPPPPKRQTTQKHGERYENSSRTSTKQVRDKVRKKYRGQNKCEQKYEQKCDPKRGEKYPGFVHGKIALCVGAVGAGHGKMALCVQVHGLLELVHSSEGCGRIQSVILYCECLTHSAIFERVQIPISMLPPMGAYRSPRALRLPKIWHGLYYPVRMCFPVPHHESYVSHRRMAATTARHRLSICS